MNKELTISKAVADTLEEALNKGLSDCSRGETLFDQEVLFEDGTRMVIQVIAGDDEPAWSQAVLLDPEGFEIKSTDVLWYLIGKFQIDDYTTIVKTE